MRRKEAKLSKRRRLLRRQIKETSLKDYASVFATVALPIVLALGSHWISLSLKDRDVRLRNLELAIEILSTNANSTENSEKLRVWAEAVMEKYSEVPWPKGATLNRVIPVDLLSGPQEIRETKYLEALYGSLGGTKIDCGLIGSMVDAEELWNGVQPANPEVELTRAEFEILFKSAWRKCLTVDVNKNK